MSGGRRTRTDEGGHVGVPAAADGERWARAAWSALIEPGDEIAGALVAELGAAAAWHWLVEVTAGAAEPSGVRADALPAAPGRARLARAVQRWSGRLPGLRAQGWGPDRPPPVGGGAVHVVVPGDPTWPTGLDDLGAAAPPCVWVRGELPAARDVGTRSRVVALVGARASTSYGDRVAVDLARGLVDARFAVVSGGAYGIDAMAHRGTLAAGGRTLVVLAGGVDRAYPAGNARLLEDAVTSGGALVAEVPPGSLPTRSRFLQRNRLIAAWASATVVVEAAWRSGALSTAHHATRTGRPVGAVPGPVTSMASTGCHRLLRDGIAVCVTDAAEVVELAGDVGPDAAPERAGERHALDGLDEGARRVHDALSPRSSRAVDVVARGAGLTPREATDALGLLELAGLAVRGCDGWRARP